MAVKAPMAPGQTEEVIYVDLPPDFEISEPALKHLKAARRLISGPYGWTKDTYFKTRSDGRTSFCVVGALNAAHAANYDDDGEWSAHNEAIAAFSRVVGGRGEDDIYVWNDAPKRRKGHVLAAFDELIARNKD